jgi:hypothetical protein
MLWNQTEKPCKYVNADVIFGLVDGDKIKDTTKIFNI